MPDYSMYPAPDFDPDEPAWPETIDWSEPYQGSDSLGFLDLLIVSFLVWIAEAHKFVRFVLAPGTATSRPLTISEPCARPVLYPTYRRPSAARAMTGAGSMLAPPVGWLTPTGSNTP
jgi:hypothetical protein